MPSKSITKAEFYGGLTGVFAFIFAVHLIPEIEFQGFRDYVTLMIGVALLVSFISFLRALKTPEI